MSAATFKLSYKDVLERRAFVRLPPAAKIELCHRAGAPWSETKPKARLSPVQQEILSRPEREKILHGGSGLGKSVLGGCEGICELMLPNSRLAVVASMYSHVGDEWQYIDKGMRRLFKGHPAAFRRIQFRNSQNYHDFEVHTIWNSMGRGYSTDSDEGAALLGKQFNRAILGEGSHVSHEILEKKLHRALDRALTGSAVETGYLTIFTTPKGYEGCSAAEWERVNKQTQNQPAKMHYGAVPFAKSVYIREASVLENPEYDRSVFEARKDTLDRVAFEEQYLGKMTYKTGIIIKEFRSEDHVRPLPGKDAIQKMRLGVGMDTGAYFGAVLYGIYRQNQKMQRWVLGETYTAQRTISDSLDELREMIVSTLAPSLGTNDFEILKNRIEVWAIDPASQHKMEVEEHLDVGLIWTKQLLEDSISRVRQWFKNDELWVVEGSDWLIDQMRKWVWVQKKSYNMSARHAGVAKQPVVTVPKGGYDHVIDALRIVADPIETLGPYDQPPEPITLQEEWDRARKDSIHGPLRKVLEMADRRGGVWA